MSGAPQQTGVSLKRRALRQKILNVALASKEFRDTLAEAAREIREQAKPTATEATIEGVFERVMYARLREIGLRFHPEKEVAVNLRRHLASGRMDSRLGALVIEYKRPSLLKSDAEIETSVSQLASYLRASSESAKASFVGILTNGLIAIEVRASGDVVTAKSAPQKVDAAFLLRMTRHVVSLALTALTPTNLIRDFCGSQANGVLLRTARVLNVALREPQLKTQMLHSEWEEMFRLAHDDQSQQKRIEERREALAALFEVGITGPVEEYRALFALHTAYAVLLKFMAYRTVSDIYLGEAGQDYGSLATASNQPLRAFCEGLEDGEVFRALGIINLLEGDFFSWYCDRNQWTPAIADALREMLDTLARYEEAAHIFEANEAPDLFRELYQAAVPRVVRSSFGEFYTPYWLADHVIGTALPRGRWRAIDPCCGSGTFVIAAIARVRRECEHRNMNAGDTLQEIVERVVAIDLNPLGVLTTRINYFIHISHLFRGAKASLVIPVFLGDAAAIPDRVSVDRVPCLRFELKTLKNPIRTVLPISAVQDTAKFMQLMLSYERQIKAQKRDKARETLLAGIASDHRTFSIRKTVHDLTDSLIELEQNGWNGIWARILSNFLTTACLGKFSVVVGNPPWIDWKNLPAGYRERIKAMCIDRGLFSGAGRTGGINLNICALISYVAMTNWLRVGGRLALLMPKELANQASYEGWRRLGGRWSFLELHDWSDAGHPFDPVKEDFMTFVLGQPMERTRSVSVTHYRKTAHAKKKASEWASLDEANRSLEISHGVAGQIIANSTSFTFARNQEELDEFALVAGDCEYIGREGIEFYPQELLLFRYSAPGPKGGTVWVNNVQVSKSKYKIPSQRILLETTFLHPLVKGPEIGRFEHDYSGLLVAFPYDVSDPIRPIARDDLRERSPHLLAHYEKWREVIDQQTKFSDKIRGQNPGEFYGLARTGPYSFAETYVAFRDNTKWCATVVTDAEMRWGEHKRFVFQNHAVSMCERRSGDFIDEDEAHFVCAILNTSIVERFIYATSDNRSFKIRPPVFVPLFDAEDDRHLKLVQLSREAHEHAERREEIRAKCENVYLTLCGDEAFDVMVARDRIGELKSGKTELVTGDALQAQLTILLS